MDYNLLLKIWVVGVLLNVVWEIAHHRLYETCRQQTWEQNMPLLLFMSLKDGLFIVLFYSVSAGLFGVRTIFEHVEAWVLFVVLALTFSFLDEKISTRLGRWEYASSMPTLWGVGITPLLEIAVTGLLAVWLVSPY